MIEQKKELTGYPSVDKPWLKYYTEGIVKPKRGYTIYDLIYEANKEYASDIGISYFGNKISYGEILKK